MNAITFNIFSTLICKYDSKSVISGLVASKGLEFGMWDIGNLNVGIVEYTI
jgi:hypothetical protein